VKSWRQGLIAAHIVFGIAVVAALVHNLGERAREVNDVKTIAQQETDAKTRIANENAQLSELLKGREQMDPYVIELLARERLGYTRPGEIPLPPVGAPTLATVDSAQGNDNK